MERKNYKKIFYLIITILFLLDLSFQPSNTVFPVGKILKVVNKNFFNKNNTIEVEPFSDEYLKYLELSDEEKEKVLIVPKMYEINYEEVNTFNKKISKFNLPGSIVAPVAFPSYYDLVEKNCVTPVKNQRGWDYCWAYAGNTSLESHILNKERNNIDENCSTQNINYNPMHTGYAQANKFAGNVDNVYGNKELNIGGNSVDNLLYYTSGLGPVSVENFSIDSTANVTYQPANTVLVDAENIKINSMYFFPRLDSVNASQAELNNYKDLIKKNVLENGGVAFASGAPMMGSSYFNPITKAVKTNTLAEAQGSFPHMMVIVGWDDTYNKDNFSIGHTPNYDGAWIVQNSWGQDITYYYSYEDAGIYNWDVSVVDEVEQISYDNIYQYNPSGFIARLTGKYAINVFEKNSEKEVVTEISFYNFFPGVEYNIYVNSNYQNNSLSGFTKVANYIDSNLYEEYLTIKLNEPIEITGAKFAVMIEIVNNGVQSYNIPIQVNSHSTLSNSAVGIKYNQSFASINGTTWTDLASQTITNHYGKTVSYSLMVKAFTKNITFTEQVKNLELTDNEIFLKPGGKSIDLSHLLDISMEDYNIGSIIYEVNNTNIAQIDGSIITANQPGDAIVTISTIDGSNLSKTLKVKVLDFNLLTGNGTEVSPYIINNISKLNYLNVPGYYKLAVDLDLTTATSEYGGMYFNEGLGFNPIGYYGYDYDSGSEKTLILSNTNTYLDGNNKTLSGLNINRLNENYVGLFSNLKEGIIQKLNLDNSNVIGKNYVGGIVGHGSNAELKTISANVLVEGNTGIGGLAGSLEEDSVVFNSNNLNNIKATVGGGIVGITNNTNINSTYNAGNIHSKTNGEIAYLGGIAGKIEYRSSLDYLYNIGEITSNDYAGGITAISTEDSVITNSFNTGKLTGYKVAGIVFKLSNTLVDHVYNVGEINVIPDQDSPVVNRVGALVGETSNSTLRSGYYINDYDPAIIISPINILNVYKLSVSELKDKTKYSTFDFIVGWEIKTEGALPTLRTNPYNYVADITSIETLTKQVGETYQLEYSLNPVDAFNKKVIFTSDDESIALISETGKITAIAKGTTYINILATDRSFTSKKIQITINGLTEPETDPEPQIEDKLESEVYDIQDEYIYGVKDKTSVDTLLSNLSHTTGTIAIEQSANYVGTGTKINILKEEKIIKTYTVIVIGDVNGNGKIDIIDYIRIMKDIMNMTKLSGVYIKAADVNGNGKIDIIDYIRIMKMIMEEN